MARFKRKCPRCKKTELRPIAFRITETGYKAMPGYHYCPACDSIFREELKEVTVHDQ